MGQESCDTVDSFFPLILTVTSIHTMIVPFCRWENWGWEMLGILKGQWGSSHALLHVALYCNTHSVPSALWILRSYIFGYPIILTQGLAQSGCLNLSKSSLVLFYAFLDRSLCLIFPGMWSFSISSSKKALGQVKNGNYNWPSKVKLPRPRK